MRGGGGRWGGKEEQSETAIKLQSVLLSDLFRILNQTPDTPKQKMKR